MSLPVWSVENKVAWNYLIVADVHLKGSTVEIFQYNNTVPENIAMIESVSSKTMIGLETILGSVQGTDDDDSDDENEDKGEDPGTEKEEQRYEQDILQNIIDFGNEFIPEQQRARTPILFHGTGNVRSLRMYTKHKLMRTACSYIKGHSNFLVGDCKKQFSLLHEDLEGVLLWVSANYAHYTNTKGLDPSKGTILLGNGGLTSAYLETDSPKSKQYKVSIASGNTANEMYNVDVQSDSSLGLADAWEAYVKTGDLNCANPGSKVLDGKGLGDYKACVEALKPMLSGLEQLPSDIAYSASGELPAVIKLLDNRGKRQDFCATRWSDLKHEDYPVTELDRLCFKSAYADALLTTYFPETNPGVTWRQLRWGLGRALLYASADVSKPKKPTGIQSNTGSTAWQFSLDVKRPLLGDFAERLDRNSHRMWGGIVFISILFAIVYLLLGKRKRLQIFSAIRGKIQSKYAQVNVDDFELEETRDDFDV